MKYVILVPDGMDDYPVEELGNKTPLEAARTLNMDSIAQRGKIGSTRTVPPSLPPASDVANLSLLGYDPEKYYSGRGSLEAANVGIELFEDDVVFRCNLVTVSDSNMVDYSAGHITTKEASVIVDLLNERFKDRSVEFFLGTSYRNLMLVRNGRKLDLMSIKCTPPHDIVHQNIVEYLPRGKNSSFLKDIMFETREFLENDQINKVRIDLGENPANMIWLWGQGVKPNMPSFKQKFNLDGSVISAVDLIKGIGKLIGLDVIEVPGATGYYDTNYKGKAEAGIRALKEKDFLYLHLEAIDEAGHNKDLRMKISCIEQFDSLIVGPIINYLDTLEEYRVLILADHPTSVEEGKHASDNVGFIMAGKGIDPDDNKLFSERVARKSPFVFKKAFELTDFFLAEGRNE